MDRLDAMRAFSAVADLGSFAEAARRLHLSPTAVTRAVALLERQLGTQLLSRTTRSVRLTEAGMLYRESCRQILRDVEDSERRIRGENAAPRGMLTVAAPIQFGRLHVLPIVEGLLRAHRDLAIRLILSDRMMHLVDEGIDVAVRIGALADSALRAVKLGEVTRVLVASPAYLADRGTPAQPRDLHRHDLIAFENVETTDAWHFGGGAKTSVRIAPRLAVNTAEAAIAAAEAGLGITRALSYQVRESVAARRLELLLDRCTPPAIPVSLVYPERRLGAANVAGFVAATRAHFRRHPLRPLTVKSRRA